MADWEWSTLSIWKPSSQAHLPSIDPPAPNAPTRIKWDEDNLALMESQKNSTMKITEPKTPFIHHSESAEQLNTMLGKTPFII